MKRLILLFSVFLFIILLCHPLLAKDKKGYKIKTVVIDAGHGGKDPGAVGSNSKEKDITLKVALKLGTLIETNYPDVKVIYTRKTDVFVELYKRAQIANQNKAELFISIHCNSASNAAAFGAETFVMGLHKSQQNLEVAKKENAAVLLEDDYTQQYDGFDPNSPESNIIFSLFQNAYLDQSLLISQEIQQQYTKALGMNDRGVKQAGFLVLYKVAMPGLLTEIGFLSNKKEEKLITSEEGMNNIASSIFSAFKTYKEKMENDGNVVSSSNSDPVQNIVPKEIDKPKNSDSITNLNTDTSTNKVSFRVQFSASSTNKPPDAPEFASLKDVKVYLLNSLYRYTTGDFKTLNEAVLWQREVQDKGFKDAFVVAFHNEIRISTQEAVKLIKKD